ncbi:Remorin [Apostasia shenzhenica]|uniref:Remorin n=1 Tax=Apostasia shenzhenica TaxID=1088818 RepID=A0A2H9ZY49_9ASPA|nr:Remorin [Apostasia shenzhenica]
MDYERIEKRSPLGGGFSPSKLRAMLLGVEKRRKSEEELEARFSLRSEIRDVVEAEDRRVTTIENCKDVDIVSLSSRLPAQEELPDVDGVLPGFEFQRAERAQHLRSVLMPQFSKPAPSKWDDAQKWIASPTSNRQGKGSVGLSKKTGFMGYIGRHPAASAKVILEVAEEAETKRIDMNQGRQEVGEEKGVFCVPETHVAVDPSIKPSPMVEDSMPDPAIDLSQHDSSASDQSATTCIMPSTTVKSVSMRDMGTEMTPMASEEPSRTGTPAGTRSPTNSRPSTPTRSAPTTATESFEPNRQLSEKELRIRTRREIMILGTQLGKANIAAWASKEDEQTDASASLKTVPLDQPPESVIEIRAAAWEEAETAKYQARYKREEIKIQAWENHQKAKTEAELRKIEVEVERMRARTHDKLMSKLATARHKAEEKRAEAEAARSQQAARTAQQAEYIRRTGRIPSSFSCWGWCS